MRKIFLSVFFLLFTCGLYSQNTKPIISSGVKASGRLLKPTLSMNCPNMGFEQLSFAGWTGSTGTVSVGSPGGLPVYNITGNAIVSIAGNNTPLKNPDNYHTLMTSPPQNPVYPNCIGYDSLACKVIGTNTVSQIPFINPYNTDGVCVRMNGAVANKRACKLKYVTTTTLTNQKLTYSFAFVLKRGGHFGPENAPYFKVEVKNEANGTLVTGCNTSKTFSNTAVASDSVFASPFAGDILYRKWKLYTVDLSSLPLGTNVSVNFEVSGCVDGNDFGYAYVDAGCGDNSLGNSGFVSSNFCTGSSQAILVAPPDYKMYQWYNSSGSFIPGSNNDTLIVSSPVVGATYSVQLTTESNCIKMYPVTISTSTIAIKDVSSQPSCIGGNSGSATVYATGSDGIYTYTWTDMSNGAVVSNSQSAVNLAPGNYSVVVSSGSCGQASSTVSISTASTPFTTQIKLFCGNSTFIANTGGNNYRWYAGSFPISAPNGNNDTLVISNAINNSDYTIAYTTSQGCADSIKYTLQEVSGGLINISNINNVCPGNSNGSAVITLFPKNTPLYNFKVEGLNGTITTTLQSAASFSVTNLATGTYTVSVIDGNCMYTNVFSINPVQTTFTMTAGYTTSCLDTTTINFDFGSPSPANCGLSPTGLCASPAIVGIGNGTITNRYNRFPSVYGNWYRNARHQLLYTAAELLAAGVVPGKISGLSFRIDTIRFGYVGVLPELTIKMKCTSATDVSTAFDNNNLSQVYSTTSYSPVVGWNTHVFTDAYEWDGVSNILVDVCYSLNTGSWSNNPIMPGDSTLHYSCAYAHNDAVPLCGAIEPAHITHCRPNIKFENCSMVNPATYSISVSSNGNIIHNYNNDSIVVVAVGTPTAAQEYTITVTNSEGGCTDTQTYLVPVGPKGAVTYTNASCAGCPDGAVNAITFCGTPPYSYSWTPGGATTQYVSGLMPGCYTVTITDAANQMVQKSACIFFATGLENNANSLSWAVYPNPGDGIYNIDFGDVQEHVKIEVVNLLGQNIFQTQQENLSSYILNIRGLAKGVYYIKLQAGQGSTLTKLILE